MESDQESDARKEESNSGRTHPSISATAGCNVNDAQRIVELEEQLAQMRAALQAAGLMRGSPDTMIAQDSVTESNAASKSHESTERKSDMSVVPYNSVSTDKLQFAGSTYPTAERQIECYVDGLSYEYKASTRNQPTLELAMEEARRVENDLISAGKVERKDQKRKWEGPSSSSSGKSRYKQKGDKKVINATCRRCGKRGHLDKDCRSKEVVCYNCKEMGHYAFQCGKPDARKVNLD